MYLFVNDHTYVRPATKKDFARIPFINAVRQLTDTELNNLTHYKTSDVIQFIQHNLGVSHDIASDYGYVLARYIKAKQDFEAGFPVFITY